MTFKPSSRALLFLLCLMIVPLHPLQASDLYCDSTVEAQMIQAQADELTKAQNKALANWPQLNDFNSMFCGMQISNNFDSINGMLAGAIFNPIKGLLNDLMSKACEAIVSPIKQAAGLLCIPAFNFNLGLTLPALPNGGTCSGTPLFNVTPVFQGSYNYRPTNQSLPVMP